MNRNKMQVAILVGGLATRLRPLTSSLPKAMLPIKGKPFLEYQVALLNYHNVRDIVLCVGYLKEKIKDYFGDGGKLGVNIQYSEEEELLGTAGALKNAELLLEDEFLLLNGDSYLPVDYAQPLNQLKASGELGLMVRSCQKVCKCQTTASTSFCLVSVFSFLSLKPDSR
jgi:NDP-sugar pyrophosphorylase family protein